MKQCQVIAVVNGKKTRVQKALTESHRRTMKEGLTNGFVRAYSPKDADGDQIPAEKKIVQIKIQDELIGSLADWADLLNLVATQDVGNCSAKGDVVVGKNTIIQALPVTNLLFLEKNLADIRKFFHELPVLDPAETWSFDQEAGVWKTEKQHANRTKKHPKVIVKYDATDKHPAQTELFTEDVIVGQWSTTKMSSALSAKTKAILLGRVDQLIDAVKVAREAANQVEVENKDVGSKIVEFLLSGLGL
ncbi:MAG: hypothetical protein U9Q17_01405 [Chloroflexota bacterium]|nr:hypothetical protein [Chloroflexota bacterium]